MNESSGSQPPWTASEIGVVNQLSTDFDKALKNGGEPRIEEYVKKAPERLRTQLPDLAEAAKVLPQLLQGFIQQAADGRLRLQVESPGIAELKRTVQETNARRDRVTVAAVLLGAGLVWVALSPNAKWPGWVLAGIGALWLIVAWRRGN